jgi:hypothetical protein
VSSENLRTNTDGSDDTQSFVNNVNKSGESTQPWGAPVFRITELEKDLLTLTTCGRSKRKSKTQWQMDGWTFRTNSLSKSMWGMMVLKALLKSKNKTLA